jgi:hypothetical protein
MEVLMRKRSSFLECLVQRVFHHDDFVSVGFVGGVHEENKERERERESERVTTTTITGLYFFLIFQILIYLSSFFFLSQYYTFV